MRLNTIVMLVLAVVFGGSAVLTGRIWLKQQDASRQQTSPVAVAQQPEAPPAATVVVAAAPLRYGDELTARNLREVAWPAKDLPPGAFRTMADLVGATPDQKRVALAAMEPNEPILPGKITGPGQRGTLSSLLEEGMGAITIQVNEIVGVAGFVLPGDRVDVLLTRHEAEDEGGSGSRRSSSYTDVVLQNVRVLASGQLADERANRPAVVSAVTIEVGPIAAQKVALAAKAGALSLMLRKAGETASSTARRVALSEVGHGANPAVQVAAQPVSTTLVRVTRGMESREYAVPAMSTAQPFGTDLAGPGTDPVRRGAAAPVPPRPVAAAERRPEVRL